MIHAKNVLLKNVENVYCILYRIPTYHKNLHICKVPTTKNVSFFTKKKHVLNSYFLLFFPLLKAKLIRSKNSMGRKLDPSTITYKKMWHIHYQNRNLFGLGLFILLTNQSNHESENFTKF